MIATGGRPSASILYRAFLITSGATSLVQGEGTALVIHANPDDLKTDPAGNAGARIACGVIAK